MLMREAAKVNDWTLNNAGIAAMWRGGCIIKVRIRHTIGPNNPQSVFLSDITDAYRENPKLENLLTSPFFLKAIANAQAGWRRVVAQST